MVPVCCSKARIERSSQVRMEQILSAELHAHLDYGGSREEPATNAARVFKKIKIVSSAFPIAKNGSDISVMGTINPAHFMENQNDFFNTPSDKTFFLSGARRRSVAFVCGPTSRGPIGVR